MSPADDAQPDLVPVVLAGGRGARLWPVSRAAHPKQFAALTSASSLFAETLARLAGLQALAPLVIAHAEHRFLTAEALREADRLADATLLLEPASRGTAPAVAAAAAAYAGERDPVLLVLPADHAIADPQAFQTVAATAYRHAADGALVTFGIPPSYADTGYGYIEVAEGGAASRVLGFVEKPDAATAEAYLAAGTYYWNSGMFAFRASVLRAELARFAPDILAAAQEAYASRRNDLGFVRLDENAFAAAPKLSLDYAVMEHTDRALMVPFDGGWHDIGAWDNLYAFGVQSGHTDTAGNLVQGDVVLQDCQDSLVRSQHRLVAGIGLDTMVVVETGDAVLVAPQSRSRDVKQLVARLEADGRDEATIHHRVHRPWGSYELLDRGNRFLVKRIVVSPQGCLSEQRHYHRAEHWVVVRGTARVSRDGEVFLLTENQSIYLPLGCTHRLENPGRIELELIEVQSGSYLGEDDIERFDDSYNR